MTYDVSTLANIYRMITPADLLGAQRIATGTTIDISLLKSLLDLLYNVGSGGTLTADGLSKKIGELLAEAPPELVKQFQRVIQIYKTGEPCEVLGRSHMMAKDRDGTTVLRNISFDQIVGPVNLQEAVPSKDMSIILCNSGFLSPQVRNTERVEMFMNYMPTIVASRMLPFLEVEFAFKRTASEPIVSAPHAWSPGLMKFLLGSDQPSTQDPTSPTSMMISAMEVHDQDRSVLHSIAGMEMFTSPQTLVNTSPEANKSRYTDVLDSFRPLMSIESFSVSVTPTVGMYSYKKASLVMKMHDRSRLSEIGDLIRPQVYQDAGAAPTVWITYGWRHPSEPGNPYADFINGNMLVREAYGVINSQFSFDQTGQVTITVELWTKGVTDLRTLKINDSENSSFTVLNEMRAVSEKISKYRNALGMGTAEGVNREIRSTMIVDAAINGTFTEFNGGEIRKAINELKKSFSASNPHVNMAAVNGLIKELEKYYHRDDHRNLDFQEQIKAQSTSITNERFREVIEGVDPFLPFDAKDAEQSTEKDSEPNPLTSIVGALNAYQGESEIKGLSNPVSRNVPGFRKKAASFGKLLSVFLANTFKMMDGVDELQTFFYQFNDRAGLSASTNISQFPIDMPVFLDQFREIVSHGGEGITLEQFLKLVIDAQISDHRAIGYGFRSFFAPYDPANKHSANTRTGSEQAYANALDGSANARGPFTMPVIEIYVETVYASTQNSDVDLLHQFESSSQVADSSNRPDQYKRIMRLHIFDRANSPYKLAGKILRGDSSSDPSFIEVDSSNSAWLKQQTTEPGNITNIWQELMSNVDADSKVQNNPSEPRSSLSSQDIKNYVSKMVPTIVYGGNASSVISANLASKQDPLLAASQMQSVAKRSGKPSVLQPNGTGAGGLPLRVIPASMTMTTLGCPLLSYGQLYFIDFSTGTTVDNLYGLTGVQHTLTPGKFESNLTLTFYDAYGKFEGAPTIAEYVASMQVPT